MSRWYGKKPEPVVQLPPHTIEVAAPSAPPAPAPVVDTPVDDGDDNDVPVDDGEETENDS